MSEITIYPNRNSGNARIGKIFFKASTHKIAITLEYVLPDEAFVANMPEKNQESVRHNNDLDHLFHEIVEAYDKHTVFSTNNHGQLTSSSANVGKHDLTAIIEAMHQKRLIGTNDARAVCAKFGLTSNYLQTQGKQIGFQP